MWLHRISAGLIWLTTFVMALWLIAQKGWTLSKGLKPAMGLSVLIVVTFPILGGIVARYASSKTRWKSAQTLKMKKGHKAFSYLLLLAAWVTLVIGGISYSDFNGKPTAKNLSIVGVVVIGVLLALFETSQQRFKRGADLPFVG